RTLDGAAGLLQVMSRLFERARGRQLPSDVVKPRLVSGEQFERDRLVIAGQLDTLVLTRPDRQPELLRPTFACLVQIAHAQSDVIESVQIDHPVTRTGIRLMPLKKFDRRRSGCPVSANSTLRERRSSNVIWISSLARWAPRQWWTPPGPNVMCGLGVR